MNRRILAAALCLAVPVAFACGGSDDDDSPTPVDAGHEVQDAGHGTQDAGHIVIEDEDAGTPVIPDAGPQIIEGEGSSIVWMHTGTALYKGDLAVSPFSYEYVGDFDCPSYKDKTGKNLSMTDLAVDAEGNLIGVASKGAMPLSIQGSSVKCTDVFVFPEGTPSFMGLTYAPKGTLDENKEVLVGAENKGGIWRIDETTGDVTQIGSFGTVPASDGRGHDYDEKYVGKDFGLSGDIVFMSNEGSPVGFATVRECASASDCPVDTLVEIDLSKLKDGNKGSVVKSIRGQVVKGAGCNDAENDGYGSTYGIAAYEAKVYGFTWGGDVVEISNVDGGSCLVTSAKDSNGGVLKFAGAGISTAAKVEVEFQ